MSEESLEAGVAEVADVAEAAPVEAAPVEAAPTEEAPAAEAPAEAESSLVADAEPQSEAEAPVSFPSAEEFGWDEWDGKHDSFPEQLQPWGERIGSYYQSKLTELNNDLDRNKEIYDALLGGQEDPRVAQFQQQVSDLESKYQAAQETIKLTAQEYKQYQEVVQQAIDAEAEEYAVAFREANPELFEDGDLKDNMIALLNEGWTVESAAVASRLPEKALSVAREAKANGVPDSYALRLAEGAKSKPEEPRPGAQITAGATTPARAPEQASLEPDTRAMSLREFRTLAARRALTPKTNRRA